MNFTELTAELLARGTDYLDEDADSYARAERWINQAYREILSFQMWPFVKVNATGPDGAGYVDVPDLKRVRFVVDLQGGPQGGSPLKRTTLDDLADDSEDLLSQGTPDRYYIEDGRVYGFPLGGTIKVYYVTRGSNLSGTDEPLFDDQYHDLIIDRAMMKAYKDSDNFEAFNGLKPEYAEGLQAMVEDYMIESREPRYIE